jgi:Lrp/AsnC family transcriptional regulator for asnA, asnC and gidA
MGGREPELSMDSVDFKLLRIITDDARTPLKKMAREVGLSPSGVRRRIKRLERVGVIKQYSVLIDPQKCGYKVLALVTIEADSKGIKELVRNLQRRHEVCELHKMTGEDRLVAKIRSKDIESLNKFIEEHLNSSDSVRRISTAITMETYKETPLNP